MIKEISERLRYFLTSDAAILAEAGYIDTCEGKLLEAGRSAMWLILVDKYKADLVELAKADIEKVKATK
jgi:hypothetical protein